MKHQNNVQAIYLKDYQPPNYFVETVQLHVELKDKDTAVRSLLKCKKNPKSSDNQLVLKGEEQKLVSIHLNEKPVDEKQLLKESDDTLILVDLPEEFSLEIVTLIQPQDNTALSGLYRSGDLFCTQCEAEGFRRITFYPDRPDVMAKFTTTIVADKKRYPVLLSNGNAIDKGDLEGGQHFVTWQDPFPKPSYLFALVAGDLACVKDSYQTKSGRKVALELYVEHGEESKCGFAIDSLKRSMAWDEKQYGLEYDLDIYMIVAVQDFNMGAMENKGLNIFNAKYVLASEKTATDLDFQNVEAVIGHEYFHNWTGNRVTCRDWFQLSLKEGLTVFREQQFSADCGSPTVKRIEDVRLVRSRQFPEDKGPMAHPVRPDSYIEINNFYTMTVYHKGSEVIRMLHTLLGEDGFRKGMDLYFDRHDGQAVTTDDFVQAMSDANDIDLVQFKRWYYQAGTPEIKVEEEYDPSRKLYHLTLTQKTAPTQDGSPKDPFFMPVKVSLLSAKGDTMALNTQDAYQIGDDHVIVILNQARQTYTFDKLDQKPFPSLFGHFSAPVVYHYPYTHKQLVTMMQHDPDLFNRWDASQRLLTDAILNRLSNHAGDLNPLVQAYIQCIENPELDPELLGEMLTLPSLESLGEKLKAVPILSLIQAREVIEKQLADHLEDSLTTLFELCLKKDDHSLTGPARQWRSLKNKVLYVLGQTQSAKALNLCVEQFKQAHNMTDTVGALAAMNHFDTALRDECFEQFYQSWQKDKLVLNKWFALQATQNVESILEKIKALLKHPAFDKGNPNMVYSLLGGFSIRNPRFHQVSGAGYRLLAHQVLDLDHKNPQVAARIIEPLSFFNRYTDPNRGQMKQALLRMQQEKLSPDVYEIVSKSLK